MEGARPVGAEPGDTMLTMQEDLQYLLRLSKVDKKVHDLKQTRKDLPQRIQSLRDAIGREKSALDKIQGDIVHMQTAIQESQDAIVTESASLEESSKRLNNISTNREYDAVHLEIAAHKKNVDTANAQVLHFQQILENLRKEAEEAEAAYAKIQAELNPELEALTTELNGIEDRIAAEAQKAEEPRAHISKKTLSMYDRIMTRRGNPNIIAAVNHKHRACDVCSRNQTPQRVIEVAKAKQLYLCEGCGSILVWREDDVPALHAKEESPAPVETSAPEAAAETAEA
ncbi:MAG: Zn-ribbon protein nucleic acid-binding [Fibrobacteria bacterium]|jgi:predicted  nucleic acid-binding Zn-ribbon protein|nr:Zn-ribbon protein nucleic acid-binding [Fibrobacteria bacterium]